MNNSLILRRTSIFEIAPPSRNCCLLPIALSLFERGCPLKYTIPVDDLRKALAPRLASESQKNYAKQVNQTYRARRLGVRSEESDQRAGYQHSATRHYSAQGVAKPHPGRSHPV